MPVQEQHYGRSIVMEGPRLLDRNVKPSKRGKATNGTRRGPEAGHVVFGGGKMNVFVGLVAG